VPATDVGDAGAAFELLDDARERRQLFLHEVHAVVGAEGALGAAEEAVVVLVPADAVAGAEALGNARPAVDHGGFVLTLMQRRRTWVVDRHEQRMST
jgi:hypothetical protein